jgi:hypothetical protein
MHLTTSAKTARMPSVHYSDTVDRLKFVDIRQDEALMVSAFIPSEPGIFNENE